MAMKLLNYTAPELCFARLEVGGREELLRQLCDELGRSGRSSNPGQLLEELLAREAVETTGIGGGIAIPHARSETVVSSVVCVATLAEPVDFAAVDGEPVDVVLLLVSPRPMPGELLRVLARVSKLVRIDRFLQELRAATSPARLLDAVRAAEARHF